MRKSLFSGKLYNQGFGELTKQLEALFENGPGDLPISSRNKDIKGIIAPCVNYLLSGTISAWAYKELGESKFPELFILLGDTKLGKGEDKAYLSLRDFETPLGIVKNSGLNSDQDIIVVDELIHEKESCLELQLPFLQFVSRDRLARIKIMPILFDKCSHDTLVSIANMIKSLKKDYVIITSSNLTMYGEKFNFTPFRYNIKGEVNALDLMSRDLILKLNSNDFLEHASKYNLNISYQSIFVMLEVLKGKFKGKELMYGNSGDITEDFNNFVTYGSFIFKEEKWMEE